MWTGFRFKRFLISSLEMHLQIYREGGWLSSISMILIMASWVNIGGMFNIASLSPHLEPSMSTTIMETPSKPSQHFPKRKSLFWVRILNILFVLWYCVLSVIKDGALRDLWIIFFFSSLQLSTFALTSLPASSSLSLCLRCPSYWLSRTESICPTSFTCFGQFQSLPMVWIGSYSPKSISLIGLSRIIKPWSLNNMIRWDYNGLLATSFLL